jgi:hypothetical protein
MEACLDKNKVTLHFAEIKIIVYFKLFLKPQVIRYTRKHTFYTRVALIRPQKMNMRSNKYG